MKSFKQFMSEEDYDRIKDRRMERGGMDGGDDVTPSSVVRKRLMQRKRRDGRIVRKLYKLLYKVS